MIMNDPPTALRFSKQQSKRSVRLVIGSLQTPTAQNQSRIFAEHRDFEIGKCEHAHLVARVVVSFVTVENGLPATTNVVATYKFSIRRAIVPVHVAFDIAAVPSRGLGLKDRAD